MQSIVDCLLNLISKKNTSKNRPDFEEAPRIGTILFLTGNLCLSDSHFKYLQVRCIQEDEHFIGGYLFEKDSIDFPFFQITPRNS